MTLTKRQKILIGLCAVLLAALILDWATAGSGLGPDTASASAPLEAATDMAVPPVTPDETFETEQVASISTLADRLEDLAGQESIDAADVGDAFCPPPAWQPQDEPAAVVEDTGEDTGEDATRTFAATHELRAVMLDDSTDARAVVNDRLLRVGQEIDGFELISVSKHSAVLASDDTQVTLRLSDISADE